MKRRTSIGKKGTRSSSKRNGSLLRYALTAILAAIVTFGLSYFAYYQPQLSVLKEQFEHQKRGEAVAIACENMRMLQQRVDTKWPYAPDDPAFDEIDSVCAQAREALLEGDADEVNTLLERGWGLLRTVSGPPTVYYCDDACPTWGIWEGWKPYDGLQFDDGWK